MKTKKQTPMHFLQEFTSFWLGNGAIWLLLWTNLILSMHYHIEVLKQVSIASLIIHTILCVLFAPFEYEEDRK